MVESIRCVPPQPTSRLEFGPDSCNRVLDCLELPGRLTKLFARLRVGHVEIDQLARRAKCVCRKEYGRRVRQLFR